MHEPNNQPSDQHLSSIPRRGNLPQGRTGRKDKRNRTRPSGDVNIEITDRDVALLRLVDKFRLLNAEQLWTALGGTSNWRAFMRRLASLFHARYLDRPPAQFRPGQPARPYVYALGSAGRRELDRLDGRPRTKRNIDNENSRLKLHFLDHEIAVAEVALAFQLATERQGWQFEVALDDEVSGATGLPTGVEITFLPDIPEPLPLRPDCHFVIDAGSGARRSYLVEVDLGTEPQIRWNLRSSSILRKVIAFWQLRLWNTLPIDGVLFLTTTPKRLANMIDVVRRVDPKRKGAHFFSFALLNHCRIAQHESIFYEPLFHSAKIGYDNPRPFFLSECPKCHALVDPANELAELLPDEPPTYAHTSCPGRLAMS